MCIRDSHDGVQHSLVAVFARGELLVRVADTADGARAATEAGDDDDVPLLDVWTGDVLPLMTLE